MDQFSIAVDSRAHLPPVKAVTQLAKAKAALQRLLNPKDPLQTFKEQFEKRHPDKAQSLQDSILPPEVRAAKRVLRDFERVEQQQKEGHSIRQDIKTMAIYLRKHPEVLAHLQKNHQDVCQRLHHTLKQFDEDLARGRGGRGFEQ